MKSARMRALRQSGGVVLYGKKPLVGVKVARLKYRSGSGGAGHGSNR